MTGPWAQPACGSEFGNNDGWTVDLYPRVLADVNGDNRADVVGFGYSSTIVEMLKRS